MNKKKLDLTSLNVQSFVTNITKTGNGLMGGESVGGASNSMATCNLKCGDSAYWECGSEYICTFGACDIEEPTGWSQTVGECCY